MLIPSYITNLYNTTITDMIDSNFGVNCKLFFGTNKTECPNCIYNNMLGVSSNEYKVGGPVPFSNSICPYCNGLGFLDEQATEIIKLRVYFDRKSFVKMEIPINVSDGIIQTIGHIADLNKVKNCNYIMVHSDIENINKYEFVLTSDPVPFGLTKKEFICYWDRKQ